MCFEPFTSSRKSELENIVWSFRSAPRYGFRKSVDFRKTTGFLFIIQNNQGTKISTS